MRSAVRFRVAEFVRRHDKLEAFVLASLLVSLFLLLYGLVDILIGARSDDARSTLHAALLGVILITRFFKGPERIDYVLLGIYYAAFIMYLNGNLSIG
jgi:uncharacterized membrane protein